MGGADQEAGSLRRQHAGRRRPGHSYCTPERKALYRGERNVCVSVASIRIQIGIEGHISSSSVRVNTRTKIDGIHQQEKRLLLPRLTTGRCRLCAQSTLLTVEPQMKVHTVGVIHRTICTDHRQAKFGPAAGSWQIRSKRPLFSPKFSSISRLRITLHERLRPLLVDGSPCHRSGRCCCGGGGDYVVSI